MTEYFLHTGLHKTGTKFFQHKVFPNLPKQEFNYNPAKLCQYICDLMKAEEADVSNVLKAIGEEKQRLESEECNKVLISREIMSGDLFSFYEGYEERYARLHAAFPEATVIMSLRYQVDWIVSCYRETVHEHHYQTIGQFLSFEKGDEKFVKADYRKLDWAGIVACLNKLYKKSQLKFFFYEDFKSNKYSMVDKISEILGASLIPVTEDNDAVPNRGYSALAVKASILRHDVLKFVRLEGSLTHRPIRFFGKDSIPAGFESLSVLPEDKYWHDGFLRDNEEVRSKNYPDNLGFIEKLQLKFSWRNIIKEGVDKVTYKDWDMLAKYRKELNEYYQKRNKVLVKDFGHIIGELPKRYTGE